MNDCVQENAHFIVVDMVLEVLEGVKWTLSFDRWTSMMDTHQHTDCYMCTHRHTNSAEDTAPHEHEQRCKACRHNQTCSAGDPKQESNTHSDKDVKTAHGNTHYSHIHTHQHTQDEEEEEAGNDEAERQPKTFSFLSTDSGFEGKIIFTLHLIEYGRVTGVESNISYVNLSK